MRSSRRLRIVLLMVAGAVLAARARRTWSDPGTFTAPAGQEFTATDDQSSRLMTRDEPAVAAPNEPALPAREEQSSTFLTPSAYLTPEEQSLAFMTPEEQPEERSLALVSPAEQPFPAPERPPFTAFEKQSLRFLRPEKKSLAFVSPEEQAFTAPREQSSDQTWDSEPGAAAPPL
jgi:hypothetical protein